MRLLFMKTPNKPLSVSIPKKPLEISSRFTLVERVTIVYSDREVMASGRLDVLSPAKKTEAEPPLRAKIDKDQQKHAKAFLERRRLEHQQIYLENSNVRANLFSPVVHSFVGEYLTFSDLLSLSSEERTNLESLVIAELIRRKILPFEKARNLSPSERNNLENSRVLELLCKNELSLEEALRLDSSQLEGIAISKTAAASPPSLSF